MTPAERQRRRRRRQRRGLMSIVMDVDAVSVPQALVDVGLLLASDVDDPHAVARALERARITIERK